MVELIKNNKPAANSDGEEVDYSDDEEAKHQPELLPDLQCEGVEESELFNPQEIDFSEVERLRTKVATLESILANQGQQDSTVLLKCYMDSQEQVRREQSQANQQLLQIV